MSPLLDGKGLHRANSYALSLDRTIWKRKEEKAINNYRAFNKMKIEGCPLIATLLEFVVSGVGNGALPRCGHNVTLQHCYGPQLQRKRMKGVNTLG